MKLREQSKVYLIIVLTIVGLCISGSEIFAFSNRTLHEKYFKVVPGQQIKIETDMGDIKVFTWDKNEVYIKITGNKKAKDKIYFEFDQNETGVYVHAEKEGSSWFNWFGGIELKYEIKVPEQFNAYLNTSGGDISLFDLNGKAELKTSGGDVTALNCGGDMLLKTSGGDIKVENHQGNIDMYTSGGDIDTKNVKGNLESQTSGGDIKLDVKDGTVYASTSGGDVTLRYSGENMGIKLKTSGGDIRMYVPGSFGGDADLKTTGGDIRVDLPNTKVQNVSKSKWQGELNNGGKYIECRTSGGDITIKQK
ncbi:MAG: DUF4097 domain-containing protein [Bacteroidetes bacterium]|nr:DUF4097 domain-containing protein [Bacteroidota bacterium]